ncbi:unnamed protein product [Mytilus coruscus]|uniref:Uncharacterized protein n=1 Tax=Mytilus coruscus TaxID=42192 RepID=A0A6J8AB75_MYTCO|nr:unnamed protein product [Mytilus coruscus]
MPVGSSSQGDKTGVRPQGKKSTNTVQTLLSARKDLDSQKNSKLPKRTHSELSSESDNSIELSGLNLKKQIDQVREAVINDKKILKDTVKSTQEAIISANYNEQYSRKHNIKVMNFPRHEKQDLRSDFIQKVRRDLNVQLQERDVVAIHRLPSDQPGPNPVIVRHFNSDVKRSIMRVRKDLKDHVQFSDDVTRRNMQLITKLRDMECFESVWYYNCGVFGRTEDGLQLKYRLFDDVRRRLQERK